MDKNTIRTNKQKALIQDKLRAAMNGINGTDDQVEHPFITAYKTIEREIEFLTPFKGTEQFLPVKEAFESAVDLKEKASGMIFDGKVSPEGEQNLHLLEFHASVLKIHRVIISRSVEGIGLIPPAPATLQRQVEKTYESLNQLSNVLAHISKTPKAPSGTSKKAPPRSRAVTSKAKQVPEEPEEALFLPLRVSPFITETAKKGTVSIDGIVWPRYV